MMKNFNEIIKQKSVFLNNWSCETDVLRDFHSYFASDNELLSKHIEEIILFASYGEDNYSGEAFVLFQKNGKLYEVNGDHCSCFGLENQWEPEEVSLEELEHRLLKGTFGEDYYSGNKFKKELCEFLGVEFIINNKKY